MPNSERNFVIPAKGCQLISARPCCCCSHSLVCLDLVARPQRIVNACQMATQFAASVRVAAESRTFCVRWPTERKVSEWTQMTPWVAPARPPNEKVRIGKGEENRTPPRACNECRVQSNSLFRLRLKVRGPSWVAAKLLREYRPIILKISRDIPM